MSLWVYKPHAHRAHVIEAEPRPAPSILLLPQARKTLCGASIIGTTRVRTDAIGGGLEPKPCSTCNEVLRRRGAERGAA